jgi:hypothetical protein
VSTVVKTLEFSQGSKGDKRQDIQITVFCGGGGGTRCDVLSAFRVQAPIVQAGGLHRHSSGEVSDLCLENADFDFQLGLWCVLTGFLKSCTSLLANAGILHDVSSCAFQSISNPSSDAI